MERLLDFFFCNFIVVTVLWKTIFILSLKWERQNFVTKSTLEQHNFEKKDNFFINNVDLN